MANSDPLLFIPSVEQVIPDPGTALKEELWLLRSQPPHAFSARQRGRKPQAGVAGTKVWEPHRAINPSQVILVWCLGEAVFFFLS